MVMKIQVFERRSLSGEYIASSSQIADFSHRTQQRGTTWFWSYNSNLIVNRKFAGNSTHEDHPSALNPRPISPFRKDRGGPSNMAWGGRPSPDRRRQVFRRPSPGRRPGDVGEVAPGSTAVGWRPGGSSCSPAGESGWRQGGAQAAAVVDEAAGGVERA
jgi:hypothetical protein